MKLPIIHILLVFIIVWPGTVAAQLQLLPGQKTEHVFAGSARHLTTVWCNSGERPSNAAIRAHILQASSATVVSLGDVAWKQLHVLPHQTVLESAKLDFPVVKAKTKFLVQWLENTNQIFGTTEVWVYPTNLLTNLKPLLGDGMLGVLDPNNELKPLLKQNGVTFLDLSQIALEDFAGKLAILGPFQSKTQMPEDLTKHCKMLAKKNVAIVWILPPETKHSQLHPSFYTVPVGTNAIVVVQAALLSHLADNPQSQQHLEQFCQLALNPKPFTLPKFDAQRIGNRAHD